MDSHQDVARSSYADMLHDDERNHAYYAAIKVATKHLVKSKVSNPTGDRHFKCCDIGTGSSLLSMMIVTSFEELGYKNYDITAFEAFKPMAECAQRVVEKNGMSKHIKVVPTRLEDCECDVSFDLITAELLDTELIGEGCLTTYRYTVENLSSPNCIFIPKEARIYIQPICSNYLYSRQAIKDLTFDLKSKRFSVKFPENVKNCCGMPEIDDLQAHNLDDVIELAEPEIAFHFKFDLMQGLNLRDNSLIKFELKRPITGDPMVIMWWDITMINESLYHQYCDMTKYPITFLTLSCAPSWIRNSRTKYEHYYEERDFHIRNLYGRKVWREHWIRGIYHFGSVQEARSLIGLAKGSLLPVYAYHDSHSLWFDIKPSDLKIPKSCSCGVHRLLSRTELSFLNGVHGDIEKLLKASIKGSDIDLRKLDPIGSIRFENIDETDPSNTSSKRKWIIQFTTPDHDTIELCDLSLQEDVCWQRLIERSMKIMSLNPIGSFEIVCLHVVFEDLSRIRDRITTCEGFNLEPLGQMIADSMKQADESVDSLSLWEYDSYSIGNVVSICQMGDLTLEKPSTMIDLTVPSIRKTGQALVFWTNLTLTDGSSISTGRIGDIESHNKVIKWNRNYKQLIHFIQADQNDPDHNIIGVSIELNSNGLKVATRSVRGSV